MDKTPLKPLKAILETIREHADFALKQLQKSEEERSTRWRCKDCKYTKHLLGPFHQKQPADVPGARAFHFNASPEPHSFNTRAKSIIADNLSKAGWSWGCVSAIDSNGRRSGLLTRIATTESVSLCVRMKS